MRWLLRVSLEGAAVFQSLLHSLRKTEPAAIEAFSSRIPPINGQSNGHGASVAPDPGALQSRDRLSTCTAVAKFKEKCTDWNRPKTEFLWFTVYGSLRP